MTGTEVTRGLNSRLTPRILPRVLLKTLRTGSWAAAILALLASAAPAQLPEVTLPLRGEVLRVAVAGDTGDGSEAVAKGIRRVHEAETLDAILLTGDNFYPCGPLSADDPRWSLAQPLTDVGIPVFPVLGNHDYCGKAGPEPQLRTRGMWQFPARQYAIRTPVADFAMIDTTPYVRGRDRDAEGAVRSVFASSKTPYRVVVGHHPILSSGWHGYFPRNEVQRMREILPAVREMKVDLYLCGHDHHLELVRGRPTHLLSGAGSDPIPPLKLRARTIFPPEVRRERIGFAVVEITKARMRIRFYDGEGRPQSEWM